MRAPEAGGQAYRDRQSWDPLSQARPCARAAALSPSRSALAEMGCNIDAGCGNDAARHDSRPIEHLHTCVMAWHRARPDGGPTVHHTWSRPGETNPYAALDARIADARAHRDECERKVAQLSGLSTQIGQLEEQKRRSASYLITAEMRR